MPKRPDPYLTDDENPELTPEQIRAMRPAREVLTPGVYETLVGAQAFARNGSKTKEHSLEDHHRNAGGGRMQQKRSDTLNKNLSSPIPGFSPTTTLGEMRKRTGQVSESDVRRVAEKKSQ